MDKVKFELEFPIHASPSMLFKYLATPGGLEEWFADRVNSRGKLITFIWDDSEEEAKIIAKKETFADQGVSKNYTSARLNSKFAFQYGKVEVRAKLPTGTGTWPAIWMLAKSINEDHETSCTPRRVDN